MRFLIDESLPPALCKWLIARGHEADHVIRLKLDSSPDENVWARAARTGATIITKDRDYVEAPLGRDRVAVVWVRLGNTVNRDLIVEIERAWTDIENALSVGQGVIELRHSDTGPDATP
jgi:predicted nuclease of predicted toxin-antitoxin system